MATRAQQVAEDMVPPLMGQPAIMTAAIRHIAEAGYRRGLGDAAVLVEQVAHPDDVTDIGEQCAEAFNDADREEMSVRLRAWNRVLAGGIRALADEEVDFGQTQEG